MDRDLTRQQRLRPWLSGGAKALLAADIVTALGFSAHRYLQPSLQLSDVRVAAVERGPLEAIVEATGTIVPRREQTISSPVSAEIRVVAVSPGERVKHGQLVMQLDTTASELELSNLEEQLALKRAELRSQQLQRDDAIRQARSRRELLAIDLESREVRLDRYALLAETGAVSESELLEARLDVKRTRVELEQIEAEIASLEARREAELERLELDYSILDKRRADQARRVKMSSVKATLEGIVTELVSNAGSVVVEGQALATIAAEDSFRVEASVADFYGPELRPGQRAKVRSSAGEFAGRVSRILPIADSSRLDLFIELDDPAAPAFHANLRVDVDIVTAEKRDVLKLRRGPALESAGIQQLFRVDGERAVRTPVRLGLSEHRDIEIVDGLAVGDRVVISDMSAYEHLGEIRIKP